MKRDFKEAMGGLEERVREGLHELEGRGEKARKAVERFVGKAKREVKREVKTSRRTLEGELHKTTAYVREMVDEAVKGSLEKIWAPTKRALDESQKRLDRLEKRMEAMAHPAPRKRAAAKPRARAPKRATVRR